LPKNECRVIDDNDDVLLPNEAAQIQKLINQIDNGDYSEFEDWETVKTRL
jgi:hypothetical protein